MSWEIRTGDALARLREMPAGSVQTCITSPPYFGLRDYGTGGWEGGDEGCDHLRPAAHGYEPFVTSTLGPNRDGISPTNSAHADDTKRQQFKEVCGKCGARRVDQQVGLEQTPDAYVARLVEVFREVRRVLRDDGTVWLNLGDSYSTQPKGNPGALSAGLTNGGRNTAAANAHRGGVDTSKLPGLKPKDLLGIPWMVAFALRADGWYLRSDIVWSKPNPMPESVTDRPTKSHEYLFLLSKRPRYYFDQDAIREPYAPDSEARNGRHPTVGVVPDRADAGGFAGLKAGAAGANKRSVWTVATQPFPGAHFAVFPPKLVEPCVLAGSSPKACGVCGAPWVRVVEREGDNREFSRDQRPGESSARRADGSRLTSGTGHRTLNGTTPSFRSPSVRTVEWRPSCECDTQDLSAASMPLHGLPGAKPGGARGPASDVSAVSPGPEPAASVVLDPFAGAGTTGLVATRHGRSFIGIELNPGYAEMARERIATAERLGFRSPESGPAPIPGQVSIFDLDGEVA